MRLSRALIAFALCGFALASGSVALGQAPNGFNREARLTIGVTRKIFKNKNSAGPELPQAAGQTGQLTAQLFDDASATVPIWTEALPTFVLPDGDERKALVLGNTAPFMIGEVPVPFNNSPFLLLTFKLGSEEYVTPRMAIAVAGYSHQAGAAYGAVGDLLKKIEDYEKRLKVLEHSNNELVKKLYREVYGMEPPPPPQ